MSLTTKSLLALLLGLGICVGLYQFYPVVLFQVLEWQKSFNQQLSTALRTIEHNPLQAGLSLLLVSFLYGVFHAVGPGHGKFILTSYLSLEQTKLPQTLKVTWLSAIVQGLVAVGLVTLLVVIFTLSRQHFNLTLKWVERASFALMIAFGLYWLWQSFKPLLQKKARNRPLVIRQIRPMGTTSGQIPSEFCNCGHKHLPSAQEMANIHDWKSMWAVVFSIGLRPCTGAILVLFLAYTLGLYGWGVAAAMIMAVGTGLTLTIFACLVIFARDKAIQTSRWYLSIQHSKQLGLILRCTMGLLLIGFGFTLLHGSFIEATGGLLRR